MGEDKLYKGLRIKVWKMNCAVIDEPIKFAGGYSIIAIDFFSDKLIMEMSGGQPFESAYEEAERLAVLVDAELTLNGEIIRKSIKGEYK